MFFTIAVPDLSVIAHSQWDDSNTWCRLRILTTREASEELLDDLPTEEAELLTENLAILERGSVNTSVEIEGDAALSLSNFIAAYHNSGGDAAYKHMPYQQELLGFWEPPEKRKPGYGIIMWCDPDDNYHVVIAHSKDQAEDVIRELHWLGGKRQESLLSKIRNWNATPHSSSDPQRIKGRPAELLCRGSMIRKVLNAL